MYQTREINGPDHMNRETKKLFMVGLCAYIDERGLTQRGVAEQAESTGQVFSKYKKGPSLPGREWREKIARALNVDEAELVAIGKKIVMEESTGRELGQLDAVPAVQQPATRMPIDYMTYEQMMAATRQVESLVRDFQDCWKKMEDRIKLWRAVFDYLPIAALIIKDGIVIFQNRKSLEIGKAHGAPLCDNCLDDRCKGTGEDCAIRQALETGTPAEEMRTLNGTAYRIDVMPLHQNQHDYFLVTAAVFS